MTAKQYLKLHPEKYILATVEFGQPVYIAPCSNGKIQVTSYINEAEKRSALDISPAKLSYHAAATGYKQLSFISC